MCSRCDYEDFINECQECLDFIDENKFPEKAEEYIANITEKVRGMKEWADENNHATEKMADSLTRIRESVSKWIS